MSRRNWETEAREGKHGQDGRNLLKAQTQERKDLADTFRSERKEQRKDKADEFKSTAKEIRAERKSTLAEHKRDRVKLKKTQERETQKTQAGFDKQESRLDAKYESARATTKNPGALKDSYETRKRELQAEHAETLSDLQDEHLQARRDLRLDQRTEWENLREEHRGRTEDLRKDWRGAANEQHMGQHEQIFELGQTHRDERAQLKRDMRDEQGEKAYSFVDVKASPAIDEPDGVPSAQAILDAVLEETGHGEAWADGSLSGLDCLAVLHEVRLAARAWLRAQAQAVLDFIDNLTGKSLFGRAKAAVDTFFGRAGKYVREVVAAGLLAVAGPGPVIQQEAIAEGYEQQVKIQAEYLADFRKQILAGDKPLDGTFASRAEMYGNAAWSAPQQVVRAAATQLDIFDEEMREHIGEDAPCTTCVHQADLGWQPIGTLRAIGDSICLSGCHCRFVFRKGKDGEPHLAGRGPLWRAAFGRTG